jgi:hypothetical protein
LWEGNITEPLTLSQWNYVQANPINLTDPSGHCYGPFREIRNYPTFNRLFGCDNLDLAIQVAVNSRANVTQRIGSVTFIVVQGAADVTVILPLLFVGSLAGCTDVSQNQQIQVGPGGVIIQVPQEEIPLQSQATQQATSTPRPTGTPGYRTIKVYRGLSATNPGAIRIDDPDGKDTLGGLSVFETPPPGYKMHLPFLLTYKEPKEPYKTTGTVVGVLASGDQVFSGGIALYTPNDFAGIGQGHWSVTIAGLSKDEVKKKIVEFMKKYFGKES